MPNQFGHRIDTGLLAAYLVRGSKRDRVCDYVEQVVAKPNLCLLPDGDPYVYMRDAGKLRKLSIRSLVYYAIHGKAPTFWQCSCKNKSCITPNHQTGDGL